MPLDFYCFIYTALFLVELLIKDHLLEAAVQVLLRLKSSVQAPVMCPGVLLHELNDRGEEMLKNHFI